MVPWTPQHDADAYCFPASLHMVVQFYRDHHSSDAIKEAVPTLSFKDIVDVCIASKQNGTRIDTDLMKRINRQFRVLKATLKEPVDLQEVETRQSKGQPTILIYDGRYLLNGLPGGAHAGVFVGSAANGDPILNNPWVGALYVPARQRFLDAWERTAFQAVFVDAVPQLRLGEG